MSSSMQSLMTEDWVQLEKEVDEELRLEAARKRLEANYEKKS